MKNLFFAIFIVGLMNSIQAQSVDYLNVSIPFEFEWHIAPTAEGNLFISADASGTYFYLNEVDAAGTGLFGHTVSPGVTMVDCRITAFKLIDYNDYRYLVSGYYSDQNVIKSFYFTFTYLNSTVVIVNSGLLEDPQSGIHLVCLDADQQTNTDETDYLVLVGYKTESNDRSGGKYPVVITLANGQEHCAHSFTGNGTYPESMVSSVDITEQDFGQGYAYSVGGTYDDAFLFGANDLGGCPSLYWVNPTSVSNSLFTQGHFFDVESRAKSDGTFDFVAIGQDETWHSNAVGSFHLTGMPNLSMKLVEILQVYPSCPNTEFGIFDIDYNENLGRYYGIGYVNCNLGYQSYAHLDFNFSLNSFNAKVIGNLKNTLYEISSVQNSFEFMPNFISDGVNVSTNLHNQAYLYRTETSDLRLDIFDDFSFDDNCDVLNLTEKSWTDEFTLEEVDYDDYSPSLSDFSLSVLPDAPLLKEICTDKNSGKMASNLDSEVLDSLGVLEFNVSPNPADMDIFLSGRFTMGSEYSLRIINMSGVEVYYSEGVLKTKEFPIISVGEFGSGVYLIELSMDGLTAHRRLSIR